MRDLINGLLTYSRVGRRGVDYSQVETGQAVERALANLKVMVDESGAQVKFNGLPSVVADETQIVQLFQNLIGNAVKFCGDHSPIVDINADLGDETWTFAVRDNGIGIESSFLDRIFMIFQRLHTRREYPGAGIGLAVCKKIVEGHGGKIWAESEPNVGSTFYFTLPLREL
jgi:light-regulated signal transduction histidine kinase (bacteriophytochrome)